MTHQISFLEPNYKAFSRREPKQRAGESFFSWAVRHRTWQLQKQADLTPAERTAKMQANMDFRKAIYKSTQEFCKNIIAQAKNDDAQDKYFFILMAMPETSVSTLNISTKPR